MQNLFHDGGYASMGMSFRAMKVYNEGLEYRDVKEDKTRRAKR
jgi:enoyl-[acyl-carrier protein] reductase I